MIKCLPRLVVVLAVMAACGAVRADWLFNHRNVENNAVVPIAAAAANMTATPAATGHHELYGGAAVTIFDSRIYAVMMQGEEFMSTVPDVLRIKAFNRLTLNLDWETTDLATGVSVDYGSASAPAIDPVERRLYYGGGDTVYKINADTGAIIWATQINAANTTAGLSYDIVNGSPVLGNGKVFVQTSDGFGYTGQIVALNAATGAVVWWKPTGGVGYGTPVFSDTGTSQVVYAATGINPNLGFTCYDAASGSVVWSQTYITTGPAFLNFWSDLVLDSGKLYGVTYDFGSSGTLVRADAATGALDWTADTVGTDSPVIVKDGRVHVIGGPFGSALLAVHSAADGSPVFPFVSVGGAVFRNYMAATDSQLYLCSGSRLMVRSLATGALVSQTSATAYTGPVTVDTDGSVYAHYYDSGLKEVRKFTPPASASDWWLYQ
jgi:outer membrane protein assembly factor BamB